MRSSASLTKLGPKKPGQVRLRCQVYRAPGGDRDSHKRFSQSQIKREQKAANGGQHDN